MNWFVANLKTVGTLMSLVGGGLLYVAGTATGATAIIVGAVGTALSASGAFVASKATTAT